MFMKNPKNGPFWQVFENLKNSGTSQVSFNRIKIGGKCQNSTRHFGWFSNNVFSTFTFMQRKIKVFLESNFSNNVSLDLLANGTYKTSSRQSCIEDNLLVVEPKQKLNPKGLGN